MEGSGRGRSIGTRWSRPTSRSSTPTVRSRRRSRHHDATARTGQTSPIDDQRGRDAEPRDHRRGGDRPDPDGHRDQALQHPEDAGQHRVGGQPAEQREPGDVDQRVADADEGQQDQRRRLLREDADQRDRQAPQRDPDARTRHRAARCRRGATPPSDPRTAPTPTAVMRAPTPGSPVPSSSIATTTEKTVSAPRVRDCAAARPRISARSRFWATARMPSTASRTRSGRRGAAGRGGASYRSRSSRAAAHSEARGRDREHDRHVGEREQHGREERPHQRGGGVEHAADHVGAGQLVPGVAQGGQQGGVGRPEERGRDRGEHGQRVDHDARTAPARPTTAAAPVASPRRVETTTRTRSRRPRSARGESSGASIADGTMRSSPTRPSAVAPPSRRRRCRARR